MSATIREAIEPADLLSERAKEYDGSSQIRGLSRLIEHLGEEAGHQGSNNYWVGEKAPTSLDHHR